MAADSPESAKGEEKPPPTTPCRPALLNTRGCEEIKAAARKYADQPLQNYEPGAWAVLTAISRNARQRLQGMNIVLTGEQHCIGRLVDDYSFRINDIGISGNHCRIFRGNVAVRDDEAVDFPVPAFLKDTSTNGTFLNWIKLKKSSPEVELQHGDIISFLGPPHEEKVFAFVYREVSHSLLSNREATKRKAGMQFTPEGKRARGIGVGAPEGPISLDDIRSLQRSNTALRKELESHVLTIESMRAEARASIDFHKNEMKELRESLSSSYLDQINELRQMLGVKQKEADDVKIVLAEHQLSMKDLHERFISSVQSRAEADAIIKSQKGIISEREAQLEEERSQRRAEREKAAADLNSALQRAHLEAQEEIKRQTGVLVKQLREQHELVHKLQDSERESRLHVESLRVKLEETRDNLVISEKKGRQLGALLEEERTSCESLRKRSESLEVETRRLNGELESEKQAAREEAWAKVSALELEIAAVIRELSAEKRRLQGARERLILRETQLRAFYSTTEEISALFSKQQEQLKAMQRALEDEDDCDYDDTPVPPPPPPSGEPHAGEDSTQDLDCTGADAAIAETEHVAETESPGDLRRCDGGVLGRLQDLGGAARGEMVGTADLLASEGLGSWADCTAPSGHGENEFPTDDGGGAAVSDVETEEGGGGGEGGSEDDTQGSVGGCDHMVIQDSMG